MTLCPGTWKGAGRWGFPLSLLLAGAGPGLVARPSAVKGFVPKGSREGGLPQVEIVFTSFLKAERKREKKSGDFYLKYQRLETKGCLGMRYFPRSAICLFRGAVGRTPCSAF